jgi:hypothetical protein
MSAGSSPATCALACSARWAPSPKSGSGVSFQVSGFRTPNHLNLKPETCFVRPSAFSTTCAAGGNAAVVEEHFAEQPAVEQGRAGVSPAGPAKPFV